MMSELLDQFSDPTRLLALGSVSFIFGSSLKLSDLLQEHSYSWFRRSDVAMGGFAGLAAITMLSLGATDLHHLWLVAVVTWVVRGRIDGLNHGIMAAAIVGFHLFTTPQIVTRYELTLYFVGILLPLGLIHDTLQYTRTRAPDPLKWFFLNQHLYWYLIALGYLIFFSRDLEVPLSIYTFVKGYGFLYDGKRDSWLRRLGIQCPSVEERSAHELVGKNSTE